MAGQANTTSSTLMGPPDHGVSGSTSTLVRWLHSRFELPSASRIPAMEGARGLAVILVFFVHFYYRLHEYLPTQSASLQWSESLERIGHAGVDIFFVLSGYLIYGAVRSRNYRTSRFLLRRADRLYPTFLIVLGSTLLLTWLFPAASTKWPAGWPDRGLFLIENLLFMPGLLRVTAILPVAWSLSYEVFFYLALPLLMIGVGIGRLSQRMRLSIIAIAGLVYAALSVRFGSTPWPNEAFHAAGHVRLLMFAVGMILFELKGSSSMKSFFTSRSGAVLSSIAFAGSLMLPLAIGRPSYLPILQVPDAWGEATRTAGLMAGCFFFTASCLLADNLITRVMSWAAIRWLGNMSYSYYLTHSLVINGCAYLMRAMGLRLLNPVTYWLLSLVIFAGTAVISGVVFLRVEKPLSLGAK